VLAAPKSLSVDGLSLSAGQIQEAALKPGIVVRKTAHWMGPQIPNDACKRDRANGVSENILVPGFALFVDQFHIWVITCE
jgi:hypothetical protein